jgi:hypothetical protein
MQAGISPPYGHWEDRKLRPAIVSHQIPADRLCHSAICSHEGLATRFFSTRVDPVAAMAGHVSRPAV